MRALLVSSLGVIGCFVGCSGASTSTPSTSEDAGEDVIESDASTGCQNTTNEVSFTTGVSTVGLVFDNTTLLAATMTPKKGIVMTALPNEGEGLDLEVAKPSGQGAFGVVKIARSTEGRIGVFWSTSSGAEVRGSAALVSNLNLSEKMAFVSAPITFAQENIARGFQVAPHRSGFLTTFVYGVTRSGFKFDRLGGRVLQRAGDQPEIAGEFAVEYPEDGEYALASRSDDSAEFLYAYGLVRDWGRIASVKGGSDETPSYTWVKEEEKLTSGGWTFLRIVPTSAGYVSVSLITKAGKSYIEARSYKSDGSPNGDAAQIASLGGALDELEVLKGSGTDLIVVRIERNGKARKLIAQRISPVYETLSSYTLDLGDAEASRAVTAYAEEGGKLHVGAALLVTKQGDPTVAGSSQGVKLMNASFCVE